MPQEQVSAVRNTRMEDALVPLYASSAIDLIIGTRTRAPTYVYFVRKRPAKPRGLQCEK